MQLQVQERRVFKTKHRRKTITKLNKNMQTKKPACTRVNIKTIDNNLPKPINLLRKNRFSQSYDFSDISKKNIRKAQIHVFSRKIVGFCVKSSRMRTLYIQ